MGCLKDGGVHYICSTYIVLLYIQSLDGAAENKAHQCRLWAIKLPKCGRLYLALFSVRNQKVGVFFSETLF